MISVHTSTGVQTVRPTGTILESLEQAGVKVYSQCRSGVCGCCRVKLIKGKVDYVNDPLGYLDEGEILPCACFANADSDLVLEA